MVYIIAGYEYDIFNRSPKKDNKGGLWVTGFANLLRTELEATFKKEFSVNSYTVYDPKTIAFEHESRPFVESASKDQLCLT